MRLRREKPSVEGQGTKIAAGCCRETPREKDVELIEHWKLIDSTSTVGRARFHLRFRQLLVAPV